MIKINEVAFTAYAVKDLKAGRKFYEEILGLTPGQVWEDEASGHGFVEYYMGPHTLAIGAGADMFQAGKNGGTAALEVDDWDAAMKHLEESGTNFINEAQDYPSCHMRILEDPDGNRLVIHKRKH